MIWFHLSHHHSWNERTSWRKNQPFLSSACCRQHLRQNLRSKRSLRNAFIQRNNGIGIKIEIEKNEDDGVHSHQQKRTERVMLVRIPDFLRNALELHQLTFMLRTTLTATFWLYFLSWHWKTFPNVPTPSSLTTSSSQRRLFLGE